VFLPVPDGADAPRRQAARPAYTTRRAAQAGKSGIKAAEFGGRLPTAYAMS
jgi:hypothetical protein